MKTTYSFAFGILQAISLLVTQADAFPDTVRHGYTNCTACHLSPGGGGLLTPYGRVLSRELVSTWGVEGEENLLHGILPTTPQEESTDQFQVLVGGDTRYLSRKTKSESRSTDEGFLMQAQLRLGLLKGKFAGAVTLGKLENPKVDKSIRWVSPEYYLLYSPVEETRFRLGRFEPAYGLRLPEHYLWIRSELGFLPWVERDSAEVTFENELGSLVLTGFQSLLTNSPDQQNTGYTLTLNRTFMERSRYGLSAMNAEGQGVRKKSLTGFGIFSLTERLYFLAELTGFWLLDSNKEIGYFKTGFEVFKGFTPFLHYQYLQNLDDSRLNKSKSGVGITWYPRPHFEFQLQYDHLQTKSDQISDVMLIFHYYL